MTKEHKTLPLQIESTQTTIHPQLQALAALDGYLVEQFAKDISPLYIDLSIQCKHAYARHGTLPAIMRVYDAGIVHINQAQDALIRTALFVALGTSSRAFALELFHKYGAETVQTFDLTATSTPQTWPAKFHSTLAYWQAALVEKAEELVSLPMELGSVTLGGGMSEEAVRAYMNARDEWGLTFSERIWRNDAKTRFELHTALEGHLRAGRATLTDVETLAQFQVDDPYLPKFLQDLERKAKAAFSGSPAARGEFLKSLAMARREAEDLRGGRLGTKTFTRSLLNRLEKSVKTGIATTADDAITMYLDRRARYRASVLLRSEGIRASQFATWEKYKSQKFVLAIQWNLSLSHKRFDICDGKATADVGLGPGVYYKNYIPFPDHPSGICYLTSVLPAPEDLATAVPWEPSDPGKYNEVVNSLREGDFVRQINNLGARKEPPMDELRDLISGIPKVQRVKE